MPSARSCKALAVVSKDDHRMDVLTQRSELTSADRTWAANYQPDDVLYYTRGSKEQGIEPRSYATVTSIDAAANQITVGTEDGKQVTYDPERLRGITAYREISRDFAEGDRIQFTATNRELGVSNRDLGAIERIDGTQIDVKMDGDKERTVSFRRRADAALRSWLRRDLAQLPGTHRRPGIGEHGHERPPGTHQYPLRLRLRLPRFRGRADLHQ